MAVMTASRELGAGRKSLWFGLLGGGLAWTAHLIFAYAIAEFGCVSRFGAQHYLGVSTVAWLEIALTLITTIAAVAATVVAYRCYSDRQTNDDENREVAAERLAAWAGVLTSGMFTGIILFESIPILFYLRNC